MAACIYVIRISSSTILEKLLEAKDFYVLKYKVMEQKTNVITLET